MGTCQTNTNESSNGNEELCTSAVTSISVKESLAPLELPLQSKDYFLDSQYISDSTVHCVQDVLIHKKKQERRMKFNIYDDNSEIDDSENLKSCHDENNYIDNFVGLIYRNAFCEAIENLCRQSNDHTIGEIISKNNNNNNNNIDTNHNYDSSKTTKTTINKSKL